MIRLLLLLIVVVGLELIVLELLIVCGFVSELFCMLKSWVFII